jgi:hypothetical protein
MHIEPCLESFTDAAGNLLFVFEGTTEANRIKAEPLN